MGNTDFLFVQPSFLNGMARTLDIYATLTEYNKRTTEEEADARAFAKDAQAIREDMSKAFAEFEEEVNG